MKVRLLIVGLFFLISSTINAQVNVGLYGGLSVLPSNSREAQLSVFIEKPINTNWAIQPELSYVNMQWERSMTPRGQLPYRFEALSKHVEVLLPIKGMVKINNVNLYSKLGLYTTYLAKLDGRIHLEDGMDTTIKELKRIEETNLIKLDLGISLGIGFEYTVGERHKVMTEISNRMGFMDTNSDETTDDFTHSYLLNIGIIYCFNAKN